MPDGKKWRLQTLSFDQIYKKEKAQLWSIGATRENNVLANAWRYGGIIQPPFVKKPQNIYIYNLNNFCAHHT